MIFPLEVIFKMQIAMCEGWTRLMMNNLSAYGRLLEHHALLVERPQFSRQTNTSPSGACWSENYGKRTHDVNVERV